MNIALECTVALLSWNHLPGLKVPYSDGPVQASGHRRLVVNKQREYLTRIATHYAKTVPSIRIPYPDCSVRRRRHAWITRHSEIGDFVIVARQRSQVPASTKTPDFDEAITISRDDKFGPSGDKSSDRRTMAF